MQSRLFRLAGIGVLCLLIIPAVLHAAQSPSAGLVVKQIKGWQIPQKPIDMVMSPDESTVFVLTESNQVLIYEANGNLKGSFPVDPGVTAIETSLRGDKILLIDSEKKIFRSLSLDFVVPVNVSGSPFQGPADAPVTVAVFSDFE
jgi:hypothetical protein